MGGRKSRVEVRVGREMNNEGCLLDRSQFKRNLLEHDTKTEFYPKDKGKTLKFVKCRNGRIHPNV